MQIVITGGGGFLGQQLKDALINSGIDFDELLIADMVLPPHESSGDSRVKLLAMDLTDPAAAQSLITGETTMVFHLAAVVSSQAESDFDLGWRVNVDATRNVLEACRNANPAIRLIFSSSLAVYGGKLPQMVDESTALSPQSSYGMEKAIGEFMVRDYSRRNYIDGRILRLPTICVRPGNPNKAASSFVSSIIREPLNGKEAVCPVSHSLSLWLSSPRTAINNILHASCLDGGAMGPSCTVNLPGTRVTIQEMLDALVRNAGEDALHRVVFRKDTAISNIVGSWPSSIDNRRAFDLGFKADDQFDDFILQYLASQKQTQQ